MLTRHVGRPETDYLIAVDNAMRLQTPEVARYTSGTRTTVVCVEAGLHSFATYTRDEDGAMRDDVEVYLEGDWHRG